MKDQQDSENLEQSVIEISEDEKKASPKVKKSARSSKNSAEKTETKAVEKNESGVKKSAKTARASKKPVDDLDDFEFDDDDMKIIDATFSQDSPASNLKHSTSNITKPSRIASNLTSDEVLKRIPDAVLPEIDTSKKFNYHALKAAQDAGPQPSGSIEIPVARDNCLAGLTFVFTGTMPNLPRDEAQELVKRYGGKVTTAPSSKTSCVVLGGEAGPSKIQKIKKLGIKTIDEEGFIQLLRDMPADGGSGENARKAVQKQKEELKKVEMAVKEMSNSVESKPKSSVSTGEELWTTKYAPTELSHICGNKGVVEKLGRWLTNWRKNAKAGFKSPGPDGSGVFRAVIISGPPGIGKTTSAHLVAKLKGFDVIESNASDTRSKNMLIEKVTGTTSNTSLNGYFSVSSKVSPSQKNICLVMDEVDGMSGGDRGGVGQMAALCRTTNVPIILICNERTLPKMRPFDRVALDLQFRRPDANALRVRVMGIANKEGIRITPQVVDQLVSSSGSDMRQIINMLFTYSRTNKSMDFAASQSFSKAFEKSITLKPFDITAKLLSGSTFNKNNGLTLDDKIRYYFDDHDFTPLMIQENYLNTYPTSISNGTFRSHLDSVVAAADAISDGDLVDKKIHGSQPQWSLMPFHGVMSSVLPSSYIAGQGRGRYNFTSYLGQNSKTNKYLRLLQEIQAHARLKISGDKQEVRLQYLPLLATKLIKPLLTDKEAGIDDVIKLMDEYYLTKEDWDIIMELGVGAGSYEAKAKGLPTAVKSGFTRKYNKDPHPVPFMKSAGSLAVKSTVTADVPDLEETIGEEIVADDDDDKKDDDDDLSKDKYIKVSKPKAPTKRGTKKSATASTAKTKNTARGKGRASTK